MPGNTIPNALLILRQTVQRCLDSNGQPAVMLPAFERVGHSKRDWMCLWSGPAADAFYRQHAGQLKPGTPLRMDLTNLRAHVTNGLGPCITADVLACDLAAPRWPGHAASTPNTAAHASV